MGTHFILHWRKARIVKLVKVFADILVRQVAAEEHAVDKTIGASELAEVALGLLPLDVLVQTFQVEAGGGAADETLATQLQR